MRDSLNNLTRFFNRGGAKVFPLTYREGALEQERSMIYDLAWPAIVLLMVLQALFAENSFRAWQGLLIFVSCGVLLLSRFLSKYIVAPIAYAPLTTFMLATPLIFKSDSARPWMSYGLIIFGLGLVAADLQIWYLTFPILLILVWLQLKVTSLGLTSITDVRDIQALHGYFSTVWVFGFGICAYWILREYLKRTSDLDFEIEKLQRGIFGQLKNLNRLNRHDYRNVQLHGTVLNTLNAALLNRRLLSNRADFSDMIQSDINSIIRAPLNEAEIRHQYNQITQNQKLKISSKVFPWPIEDRKVSAQILEIVRELLLNTGRHTAASRVTITLKKQDQKTFLLEFKENSFSESKPEDPRERIALAQSSRTLKRLTTALNADIEIQEREDLAGLYYRIEIPAGAHQIDSKEAIFRTRNTAISFLTNGFARVTIFFSVICIPALFFLSVDKREIAVLALSTVLSLLSIFLRKHETTLVFLGTYIGLIAFALTGFIYQSCTVGVYIPWIFNYILGMVFLSALVGKNRFTRWTPILIFTAESISLPHFFYSGCADLLTGSTPAIGIIAFVAAANIRTRRKHASTLAREAEGIFSNQSRLSQIESEIELQANWIINEIAQLATNIRHKKWSQSKLESEIRSHIDVIRAFLLCSEHFESALIRELFDFVKDRFIDGDSTRVEVYGENFTQFQDGQLCRRFFNQLYENIDLKSVSITVQGLDRVKMEILLDSCGFQQYSRGKVKLPKISGLEMEISRI